MLNNILQQYYMMSHGQLEPVSKPQLSSNELIYNGNLQIPIFSNYNSEYMTMSGQINGIDAGTYTAIFIPNDGYCWEDGIKTLDDGPKNLRNAVAALLAESEN